MVVQALLAAAAIGGWLCAGWFYLHLWRWSKECKGARITIAYKRKVKIDAPLVEWLLWIRQANKDRQSGGRVVYSMGGTDVAIIKRVKARRTLITRITRHVKRGK